MSKHTRKLGAALALGFAGGVAAPLLVYIGILHFGAPRAEARPAQLRLEMEPSTPPPVPVVHSVPWPGSTAKAARHRPTEVAAPEVTIPRANPAPLGRHIPNPPEPSQ
jgi:hypothetical protein